jgi:CRP-like cAMP-binding protein
VSEDRERLEALGRLVELQGQMIEQMADLLETLRRAAQQLGDEPDQQRDVEKRNARRVLEHARARPTNP